MRSTSATSRWISVFGRASPLLLREVETDAAPRNGDEQRKAGLELMLPLLFESEPLVPGDSASCVLNVQNRHDLLVHRADVTVERRGSRLRQSITPLRSRPTNVKSLIWASVPE